MARYEAERHRYHAAASKMSASSLRRRLTYTPVLDNSQGSPDKMVILDNGYIIHMEKYHELNLPKPYMYLRSVDNTEWIKNPLYDKYMEVIGDEE